jgi:hypothetical protein
MTEGCVEAIKNAWGLGEGSLTGFFADIRFGEALFSWQMQE